MAHLSISRRAGKARISVEISKSLWHSYNSQTSLEDDTLSCTNKHDQTAALTLFTAKSVEVSMVRLSCLEALKMIRSESASRNPPIQ